ncbi:MAG TPA: T9SS type A sorting domain-containing protein [bacterium]|nr:T9SS type A sorting domain-containing protein [bacterium]
MYLHIVPAGDFGETTIRSRFSGQMVYKAATVWNGRGKHIYPPSPLFAGSATGLSTPELKFLDYEDYFWQEGDAQRAQRAWEVSQDAAPLSLFGEGSYGALVYLHYFSVGLGDPTTAEWVVIFYKILDEIQTGKWKQIDSGLGGSIINGVHCHFGFPEIIYAATDKGLYKSENGGEAWRELEFCQQKGINFTVIEATRNPWVDCLCEVVYIGTEEYTMIPEDRRGRIFRSMIDGMDWEDLNAPDTAVCAIGINPQNPYTAYAGFFNPFYNDWGLYKLMPEGEWKKLMPHPQESRLLQISCIAVSPLDSNLVLVGIDQGLLRSSDGGARWDSHLTAFPIVSIQFCRQNIYVTTGGGSRSDGIYFSDDDGKNWKIFSWHVLSTDMKTGLWRENNKPAYFFLSDSVNGVYASRESAHSWQNISETLIDYRVEKLTFSLAKPEAVIAATRRGVYRYLPLTTAVTAPPGKTKTTFLASPLLLKCYPNPFNSRVRLVYQTSQPDQRVTVAIYNAWGQQVRTFNRYHSRPGSQNLEWDGRNSEGHFCPSGVYFCRTQSDVGESNLVKLLLLR